MDKKIKILAIASIGGHWIQLMRLMPVFEGMNVVFVSTHAKISTLIPQYKYYCIKDASRWNPLQLIPSLFSIIIIIIKEKPDVVISNGAAPGLMGLLAAKILCKKTIWIDSIANIEELSLSGKMASKFATKTYTQWEHLASSKILFKGNVLS